MLLRTVAGTFRLRVLAGLPAPTIWMVTPAGAPSSEYATVPAKPLMGVIVAVKLPLMIAGRSTVSAVGRTVSAKSVTVKVATFEVINPDLAVMLVVPMATPVAIPVGPMLAIVGRLEAQVKVTPVDSGYWKNVYFAERPASERLVDRKLDLRGLNVMRDWRVCLKEYIEQYYRGYL